MEGKPIQASSQAPSPSSINPINKSLELLAIAFVLALAYEISSSLRQMAIEGHFLEIQEEIQEAERRRAQGREEESSA